MNLEINPNVKEAVRKMLVAHANCVCADITTAEHLEQMFKALNQSMYELGVITGTALVIGLAKDSSESDDVDVVVIDTIKQETLHRYSLLPPINNVIDVKKHVLDLFQIFANKVLERFTRIKSEEEVV